MRTRYPLNHVNERRLLRFSSEQKQLEDAIDSFQKNEAADFRKAEDAKIYDNETQKKTWRMINRGHEDLGFWGKVRVLVNPAKIVSERLDDVAKQRLEEANRRLSESENGAVRRLQSAFTRHELQSEMKLERVAVAREMIGVIEKRIGAIQERLNFYGERRGLSQEIQKDTQKIQKELEAKRTELEQVIAKAQGELTEQDEINEGRMHDAQRDEETIRTHIVKTLDLNTPEAMDIMGRLDNALLDAAGGRSKSLETLLQYMSDDNKKIPKADIEFLKNVCKNFAKNPGAARLMRNRLKDCMQANEDTVDVRMKTLLERMPLGQQLNISGKRSVVASKNADTGIVILRSLENDGAVCALNAKGNNGKYKCLRKTPRDKNEKGTSFEITARPVTDGLGKIRNDKNPNVLYLHAKAA